MGRASLCGAHAVWAHRVRLYDSNAFMAAMSGWFNVQSPARAVSSIWAGRRAPTMAEVTSGRRRTQALESYSTLMNYSKEF